MSVNFIEELRQYTMPELPRCPQPLVDQQTMMIVQEFNKETQGLACELDAINIKEDKTDYELESVGSDLDIQAITKVEKDSIELKPVLEYLWECKTYLQLVHAPTADSDNGLVVTCAFRVKRDATKLPNRYFEDWYQGWANGVKAALMAQPKKAWTDPIMAGRYNGLYWDEICKGRVEVNRQKLNTPLISNAKYPWAQAPSHRWL